MKAKQLKSAFLLLLTATIWGVAFVAQSVGMDYVGPFTFNAVRCVIGGAVLLPCIAVLDRLRGPDAKKGDRRTLCISGVLCGVVLWAASNLQQIGIQYTTVGKAGFITACYVVLVPVLGIFLKKRCRFIVWIGVAMTLAGLWLLCINGKFNINAGDIYVLACALVFSIHILVIDHYSPLVDGVRMSCIQFFVCGVLSGICMLIFEEPKMGDILAAWEPILYAGVLSCGVAYTLQIVGQKGINPTVASLILCLESVVSVLAGWLILDQALSARELAGCALVFAAVVMVQCWPEKQKK